MQFPPGGDAFPAALLAVLPDDVAQFRLVCQVHERLCALEAADAPAAASAVTVGATTSHSHVERAVTHEAEAALCLVHLLQKQKGDFRLREIDMPSAQEKHSGQLRRLQSKIALL